MIIVDVSVSGSEKKPRRTRVSLSAKERWRARERGRRRRKEGRGGRRNLRDGPRQFVTAGEHATTRATASISPSLGPTNRVATREHTQNADIRPCRSLHGHGTYKSRPLLARLPSNTHPTRLPNWRASRSRRHPSRCQLEVFVSTRSGSAADAIPRWSTLLK